MKENVQCHRNGEYGKEIGDHTDKEAQRDVTAADGGQHGARGDGCRNNGCDTRSHQKAWIIFKEKSSQNIGNHRNQDQGGKNCRAQGLEISDLIDDRAGFHLQACDQKSDKNAGFKQVPLLYFDTDDRKIKCDYGHDGNADEKPVFG